MNNCIYFRFKPKKYIKYYYCTIYKKGITNKDCNSCKYKADKINIYEKEKYGIFVIINSTLHN